MLIKDSDEPTTPVSSDERRAELFQELCARAMEPKVKDRIEMAVLELRLQEGMGSVSKVREGDPILDLLSRVLGVVDEAEEVSDNPETPLTKAQQAADRVAARKIEQVTSSPAQTEDIPHYVSGETMQAEGANLIGWQPTDEEVASLVEEGQTQQEEKDSPSTDPPAASGSFVLFEGADKMENALERARESIGEVYDETRPGTPNSETGQPSRESTLEKKPDEHRTQGETPSSQEDLSEFHRMLAASVADPEDLDEEDSSDATPPLQDTARPSSTRGPRQERKRALPRSTPSSRRESTQRRKALFAEADQHLTPSRPPPPTEQDREIETNPEPVRSSLRSRSSSTLSNVDPAQWLLFSAVTVAVVVSMVVLAVFLGANQVNKARVKAEQERDELYALIEKNDQLVANIFDLGGRSVELKKSSQAFAESSEPERARRALHLVRALSMETTDLRSAGAKYRQVQSDVKTLERAKSDYELAVDFWARQTRGLLGGMATSGGWAPIPDAKALLPLE